MSAKDLVALARERGVVIATAESCTGGMVSAAITDVAGSSAVLDRGFVTYSNEAKIEMLGVRAKTIADHGAVSRQVAIDMALGAVAQSNAGFAVSITGIAGPGGSDHKPEGRVCFAVAQGDHIRRLEQVDFGALGRENVRIAARDHAIAALIDCISHFD